MKKTFKTLSMVLALVMLLSCTLIGGLTAQAAYVTDGSALYTAGDANTDGNIDVCDLVAANIGAGKTAASDLDGDGTVGAYDFALIRAMILGIDNSQWTE